jgi:hypothetical protein
VITGNAGVWVVGLFEANVVSVSVLMKNYYYELWNPNDVFRRGSIQERGDHKI